MTHANQIVIAGFYKFVDIDDVEALRPKLLRLCNKLDLKGTILLAAEGINASISGSRQKIDEFFKRLHKDSRFSDIIWKENTASEHPFLRMKVRLKNEIIRMNRPNLGATNVGEYLDADEWDELINDPEAIIIDTRNSYEVALGKFKNAVDPNIIYFRDFPEWVEKNLDPEKHKKVGMYCTGGIRCEKTTALLNEQGFEGVYHLKGGIIQYLIDAQERDNTWEGDCFVFDERMAVDGQLAVSEKTHCESCGKVLNSDDLKHAAMHNVTRHICESCLDQSKLAKIQNN